MWPANNKEPILFPGKERTLPALLKFVKETASLPLVEKIDLGQYFGEKELLKKVIKDKDEHKEKKDKDKDEHKEKDKKVKKDKKNDQQERDEL